MKSEQIQISLFSSGFCTAEKKHVFPKEPSEKVSYHATWALIQHPQLGNILFDTGYSMRFFEATTSFPGRLYRWVTPVTYRKEESCVHTLSIRNISPNEIQNIVISHFHADHIAGLGDFPHSKIWCSGAGLDFAMSRNSFNGVFKGILKSLIPRDIYKRASFPEEQFEKTMISNLTAWQWDKDIYFIDLPGHSRGQLGLFLRNTNMGDLLLCADAAWSLRAITEKIYPSRIVSLLVDNYKEMTLTINKLNSFYRNNGSVMIVPTHCDSSYKLISE